MVCTCFVFHGNWLAMCHLSRSIQLKEWNNKYKMIFISSLHYLTVVLSVLGFHRCQVCHLSSYSYARSWHILTKAPKTTINKQWPQQQQQHHHLPFSVWYIFSYTQTHTHIYIYIWCMNWATHSLTHSLYAQYEHMKTNAIDLSRIFLIYHFDVHLSHSQ